VFVYSLVANFLDLKQSTLGADVLVFQLIRPVHNCRANSSANHHADMSYISGPGPLTWAGQRRHDTQVLNKLTNHVDNDRESQHALTVAAKHAI